MGEVVFVDTSPLIFLANARRLELLRVFEPLSIAVPQAVFDEITRGSRGDPAAEAVATAPWLVRVANPEIPNAVAIWDLGAGESAVLAAALEHGSRVVLDDLAGRRCARALGLPVSGTIGVVVEAARRGLVYNPRAVMLELRTAGMWLSDSFLDAALSAAALVAEDRKPLSS